MEILTQPKSIQDNDHWFGNMSAGGPSQPEVTEVDEYLNEPMFIHPAEKPQFNNPAYRAKLYERL